MPARISGSQVGQQYIWRVPVRVGEREAICVSAEPAARAEERTAGIRICCDFSFPQLPVAIVVGGLTTFVLVLLFTRPVVRLRKAARELAMGKLSARVAWPACAGAHLCRR